MSSVVPGRYKRSPFCLLHLEGSSLVARNCNTMRTFRGAERYLPILLNLGEWTSAGDLAGKLTVAHRAGLERALERLVKMGLVVTEPGGPGDDLPTGADATRWNLIDLAMQRQATWGGYDATAPKVTPPPPAFKAAPHSSPVCLPRASIDDGPSLRSVLEGRRSVRSYADRPLPLGELATFLHTAARVNRTSCHPDLGEVSSRPSPSGGARHPIEIYPVCNAVDGLEAGAYWYDPREHRLYPLRPAGEAQARLNDQAQLSAGGMLNRDPPVVLVLTAVFQRTMWKYDNIALSIILKDVGALFQTMYLVATAMGLAPCALGGGRESENARWLGLDPLVESQVGCFLLGRPEDAGPTQSAL